MRPILLLNPDADEKNPKIYYGKAAPYELITFEGGLYAAAMSVDGDGESYAAVYQSICKWVESSGFLLDERPGHRTMCHMLNPSEELRKALGYDQMDIYVPIKMKQT